MLFGVCFESEQVYGLAVTCMTDRFCSIRPGLGDDIQWSEPRPRHIREPKTRAQEDNLQVTCSFFQKQNKTGTESQQ